jgi:branched-chain amino acid transport system substrate-binding protein
MVLRSQWARGPALALFAVGVLVVAACSNDNSSASNTTGPTIAPAPTTTTAPAVAPKFSFGFVAPGSSLLLDLAYAQENALALAVSDINDGGGVLGAPVRAQSTDDRQAGSVAKAVTNLVSGGANAIIGPVSSTDAKAAIPAVAGAKTMACSGSATVPDLNTNPPQAAFYRTALPDYRTADFVASQILAQRDAKAPGQPWKVAIVARGDAYGMSVSGGLATLLDSQGVSTSVITYLPDQTSLGQPAADAAALAPNTVVAVTYEEAPRLVDQLVQAGIPAPSIIGLDAMFVPNFAQMTFPSDPNRLNGMTVIGVTGDRAFLRRLNALPSGQVLYGAQVYDCAVVIALAAEAARSTDPATYVPKLNAVLTGDRPCSTYADCRNKLAAGETIAYQGQVGTFRFDDTNSPTASRFTVANLANGNFVVAKTFDLDIAAEQAAQAAELATAAAVQTAQLQQALRVLGLYSGPIDGQPSDALTASIAA